MGPCYPWALRAAVHYGLLFLQGERDYTKLQGQTGPLVYPAGFVYIFTFLHRITGGGNIAAGQAVFAVIYLMTQAVVLWLYIKAQVCKCSLEGGCPPLCLQAWSRHLNLQNLMHADAVRCKASHDLMPV